MAWYKFRCRICGKRIDLMCARKDYDFLKERRKCPDCEVKLEELKDEKEVENEI